MIYFKKSTFIQDYERNLVESAVKSAVESAINSRNLEIAMSLKDKHLSRDDILEITDIDVDKIEFIN